MEYMPWLQQGNSCCTYVQGKSERKKNNKTKTDKKERKKYSKVSNNDNQINTYKHKLKVSNPQERSHMFHVYIHIMKFVHAWIWSFCLTLE